MPKGRRGRRDRRRVEKNRRRLYLVFDDWAWGYSIREINLSLDPPRTEKIAPTSNAAGRLLIRFEAPRGCSGLFAAVGTRIVATHPRNTWDDDSVPDGFLPIVDVRSRGVTFGPAQVYPHLPIYLTVGDRLFALDTCCSFKMLSLEPLWPPRLEHRCSSQVRWSWSELPQPPFDRLDVTSYAVHRDRRTILVSTTDATFAFDTDELVWRRYCEWTQPFTGRAHFVQRLKAFVGLSEDGHLCSWEGAAADPTCKYGKEKLFSEDPAETHVGATLVYMARTMFCLVQCVAIGHSADTHVGATLGHGKTDDPDVGDVVAQPNCCHLYRLTTFSLSYDMNGDLTTGETCRVQCYKVPKTTTQSFLSGDPVAFWL